MPILLYLIDWSMGYYTPVSTWGHDPNCTEVITGQMEHKSCSGVVPVWSLDAVRKFIDQLTQKYKDNNYQWFRYEIYGVRDYISLEKGTITHDFN